MQPVNFARAKMKIRITWYRAAPSLVPSGEELGGNREKFRDSGKQEHLTGHPGRLLPPSSSFAAGTWELWKHSHDVVFRGMAPSVERLLATCKKTAALWECRVPRSSPILTSFWSSISDMFFSPSLCTSDNCGATYARFSWDLW